MAIVKKITFGNHYKTKKLVLPTPFLLQFHQTIPLQVKIMLS
jgi:hypothetical protein